MVIRTEKLLFRQRNAHEPPETPRGPQSRVQIPQPGVQASPSQEFTTAYMSQAIPFTYMGKGPGGCGSPQTQVPKGTAGKFNNVEDLKYPSRVTVQKVASPSSQSSSSFPESLSPSLHLYGNSSPVLDDSTDPRPQSGFKSRFCSLLGI